MAKTQSKSASKSEPKIDVLVLGEHPATYFCAALLRNVAKLRVLHATIPDEKPVERACLLNPAFFSLHKMLEPLKRKLDLTAIYGMQFLADDPATRSEHRSRSTIAYTAGYKDLRNGVMKVAAGEGVEFVTPKHVRILRLDEHGLEVMIGKAMVRPRVLVLGGCLAVEQQKMLGLPDAWGPEVVRRYTFLRLKGSKWADLGSRPIVPMSLDLGRKLYWAWVLPYVGGVQRYKKRCDEVAANGYEGFRLSA